MRILGIDPGTTGAIALLDHGNVFEVAVDVPTMQRGISSKKQAINAAELARIVRELRPDVACVELVQAMPPRGNSSGMGAASAFNFGESAGVIRGVLAALGIETHYVTPQSWKTRAGLKGSDKEASRALAIRLWPHAPLGLKKHAGRAEALLIARYGLKETPLAQPFHVDREPPLRAAPAPGGLLL